MFLEGRKGAGGRRRRVSEESGAIKGSHFSAASGGFAGGIEVIYVRKSQRATISRSNLASRKWVGLVLDRVGSYSIHTCGSVIKFARLLLRIRYKILMIHSPTTNLGLIRPIIELEFEFQFGLRNPIFLSTFSACHFSLSGYLVVRKKTDGKFWKPRAP